MDYISKKVKIDYNTNNTSIDKFFLKRGNINEKSKN